MGFLYRGVHAKHPCLAAALAGIVIPGNPGGRVTPEQHNTEDISVASQYTSWTSNLDIARNFANSAGPGGAILRVPTGAPPPGENWSWQHSPDAWHEDEILLRGVRIGVEVMKP